MKKAILLLSVLMLICTIGAQAQVIGKIDQAGSPTITYAPVSDLLASWNNVLQNTGLKIELSKLTITKAGNDYVLVAMGSKYRSTAVLALNPDTNELSLAEVNGVKSICTTRNCAKKTGGLALNNGTCSACKVAGKKSDCIKTTTNQSPLFGMN